MKSKIIIGIDPGTKTGLALGKENSKEFIDVCSVKIHKAMEIVEEICQEHGKVNVLVKVEDARKITLPRHLQKHQGNAQLQGVGSVKRDCSIWEGFLSDKGIAHKMIDPRRSSKKVNKEMFSKMTGWNGRSNEHGRDAGMLIYSSIF